MFPNCPTGREREIAEYACAKYPGRVGRSSSAKALDEHAVLIAVKPHVRHRETRYDSYLMKGIERSEARTKVKLEIDAVIENWQKAKG